MGRNWTCGATGSRRSSANSTGRRSLLAKIVLPALLVAMLFRTMDAMRIYGLIDATAGCQTVPSMSCLVITAIQESRRWASGSAIAFLTAVVIGVLVVFYLLGLRSSGGGVA